jgi:hypothetical protein
VAHYLVVDPDKPLIIHHARATGDAIPNAHRDRRKHHLEPPGIELTVADIYATARDWRERTHVPATSAQSHLYLIASGIVSPAFAAAIHLHCRAAQLRYLD